MRCRRLPRCLSIEHSAERQLRRRFSSTVRFIVCSPFNRAFSRKAIETRTHSPRRTSTPLWLSIEHSAERQLRPTESRMINPILYYAFNRAFSRKAIETRSWTNPSCGMSTPLSIEHSAERQLRLPPWRPEPSQCSCTFNRAFSRKAIETGPPRGRPRPLRPDLSIEHSAERQLRLPRQFPRCPRLLPVFQSSIQPKGN